jgi:hypothetical protein
LKKKPVAGVSLLFGAQWMRQNGTMMASFADLAALVS